MLSPCHSDDVIEALVHVAYGEAASAQLKHTYRESLRNLVRLAKAEWMLELKTNFIHQPAGSKEQLLH